MTYDSAWGHLGRPPRDIMDGSASPSRHDRFNQHQKNLAQALTIVNSKKRMAKVAEVRAQYLRDFPLEE